VEDSAMVVVVVAVRRTLCCRGSHWAIPFI
jgi:hypothetical protein